MSDRLTAPTFAREIGDAGRSSQAAFGVGAVIGALGGLIGLGGAEFRLPLLIGTFRFGALQAVILNKAMSLSVAARNGNAEATTERLIALLRITACSAPKRN